MFRGKNEVARLQKRLENAIERFNRIGINEDELRSDYARYLCILVSGFLEQAVYVLAKEYCSRRSDTTVLRFVELNLEKFQNPSLWKISALLDSFNPAWRQQFESMAVDEKKAALETIVSTRNGIAHGESTGITISQLKIHYDNIKPVVAFLVSILDP